MTPRRVAVVLNGKAGALLDGQGSADLPAALAAAGLLAELVPTEAGSLPERIRRAAESGADAVLVAGGDGTVACAAQVMAGSGVPLGILPFGTMNLLAKDLGLPLGDVPAGIEIVRAGHVRPIDVADVNGHVFLCASMLGLPAQLGRHREANRGSSVRLWLRMARATLRLLARAGRLRLRVALDGGDPAAIRAAAVTVTVNGVDEPEGRSLGRSCLDGGELCVYTTARLRLLDLLRLGLRLLAGRVHADAALAEQRATAVEIAPRRDPRRPRAMRVMNDGELMLLAPPLRYAVRPGALLVLGPAP